jgi:hypothetical protein
MLVQFLTATGIRMSLDIPDILVKSVLFCTEKNANLVSEKEGGLFTGVEKICFFPGSRKGHWTTAEHG